MYCPRTTVAVVVKHQQKYLFVEESINNTPTLNQPAGHLEQNESLLEAAKRELFEETGLNADMHALLGVYFMPIDDTLGFMRFTFYTELDALPENYGPRDADIQALHWLSDEELINHPMRLRSPLVVKSVEDAKSGVRFALNSLQYFPTN